MLLDGKVAIVTGASGGLGRVECLELAQQGARIVVNDLGTGADGSGKAEEPARQLVDEIKSAGGEAIAHFGDVANWDDAKNIIKAAIDHFGDFNILINNAGFTRDRMIFSMSEEEFDSVVRVHLKGHFCMLRHATEYWRNQGKSTGQPVDGRIINSSSEAFLFGSPGQPNYAAAKAGIVALTMGVAQAMIKYGVTANVLMPRARTRMTLSSGVAEIFKKPEEGFDVFAPENISPLVTYLASPKAARISGYVFVVWGKQIAIVDRPSIETKFDTEKAWTLEGVDAQLTPHFEKLEPVTDGFTVPAM